MKIINEDFNDGLESGNQTPLTSKAMWVTWEKQRRTLELAKSFRTKLIRLEFHGWKIFRYLSLSFLTFHVLNRHRPETLIIQNPSLILNIVTICFRFVFGYVLIVDRHTNFMLNRSPGVKKTIFSALSNFTIRNNDLTIVTNEHLAKIVKDLNGVSFILPDKIPSIPATLKKFPFNKGINICFICTFAADEPYEAVFEVVDKLPIDVDLYCTGDFSHIRFSPLASSIVQSRKNLKLTGYLPEEIYFSLLHGVDVILDLTTFDHCLVCGAYEGIAFEKALVLSDKEVNRELFDHLPVFVGPQSAEILEGILKALAESSERSEKAREFKVKYMAWWNFEFTKLARLIDELAERKVRP